MERCSVKRREGVRGERERKREIEKGGDHDRECVRGARQRNRERVDRNRKREGAG